jgi:hypothetical protein
MSVFAMIMLYIWLLRAHYPFSWIIILAAVLLARVPWRDSHEARIPPANLKECLIRFTPFVLLLALALLASVRCPDDPAVTRRAATRAWFFIASGDCSNNTYKRIFRESVHGGFSAARAAAGRLVLFPCSYAELVPNDRDIRGRISLRQSVS